GVRSLFLFGLNDVIPELGLDQVGDLAGAQGKRGLVEFGNGDAVLQKPELAAGVFRAGIVGVFLRQLSPVTTSPKLLENVFGLGFGSSVGFSIRALGHGDEDVADLHLILNLIVLQVGLI